MHFSPVSWQYINFIEKYELYNSVDVINIQQLMGSIVVYLRIDISATGHDQKGIQKVAVTNRSFS